MRVVLALMYLVAPVAFLAGQMWRYECCHIDDPATISALRVLARVDEEAAACKGPIGREAITKGVSTSVPPPTEEQEPILPIVDLFEGCEERMQKEGAETVLPWLDSALAVIEAEHGRNSTPYAYALGKIVFLLYSNGAPGPALRYSEKAAEVARKVYGRDHRETTMVLHTHATLLMNENGGDYTEEAIPFLREAAQIRRLVLDTDYDETVSVEGSLAEMLFLKWQVTEESATKEGLLTEAETLAERSLATLRRQRDAGQRPGDDLEMILAEALVGRIAHARGHYQKAAVHLAAAGMEDGKLNPFACIFTRGAALRPETHSSANGIAEAEPSSPPGLRKLRRPHPQGGRGSRFALS